MNVCNSWSHSLSRSLKAWSIALDICHCGRVYALFFPLDFLDTPEELEDKEFLDEVGFLRLKGVGSGGGEGVSSLSRDHLLLISGLKGFDTQYSGSWFGRYILQCMHW